jgi:hypothetical protein
MDNQEGTFATEAEVAEEFAALMKGGQEQDAGVEPDPVEQIAEDDPEAAADVAAGETEGQQERPDRKIPFKVFDAERRRARAAEAEKREYERQFAVAQERLNMLQAAWQQNEAPAQAEAESPPDPDTDIFGYTKWLAKQQEQIQQQTRQFEETRQREAYERQIATQVASMEQQFVATAPDYVDAVKFAKDFRVKMYTAAGMNPQAAQAEVQREITRFVQDQLRAGLNPAASAYEMAKAMGYTPKQAQAAAQAAQQARTETGQFAPQKSEKLETVARAQQAHRSPTAANGGAQEGGGLSMKALADMDIEEFEKLLPKLNKNNYAGWKSLR